MEFLTLFLFFMESLESEGEKRIAHLVKFIPLDFFSTFSSIYVKVYFLKKTFCMSYIFLRIQLFIIHEIRTQIDCQNIAKGLNLD